MYGKQQSNDSVPWVVKDVHGKRYLDVEFKSYAEARDAIKMVRSSAYGVTIIPQLFAVRA